MQQQLTFNYPKSTLLAKISRLGAFLTVGEVEVLLAIFNSLWDAGRNVYPLRVDQLIPMTRYKRSRFYDHLRLLSARQIVVTRQTNESYRGEGVEFWIDWHVIDQLLGESTRSPLPENQVSDRCPTAVRQVSDSDEIPPRTLYPPKDKENLPPSLPFSGDRDVRELAEHIERDESGEEGWRGVDLELIHVGIGKREQAIEHCRRVGVPPEEVHRLIGWWRTESRGRWGIGALWWRILNHAPGRDFAEGWPDPKPTSRERSQPPAVVAAEEQLAALPFAERMQLARQHLPIGGTAFADYQRRGRDSPERWKIAAGMAAVAEIGR